MPPRTIIQPRTAIRNERVGFGRGLVSEKGLGLGLVIHPFKINFNRFKNDGLECFKGLEFYPPPGGSLCPKISSTSSSSSVLFNDIKTSKI